MYTLNFDIGFLFVNTGTMFDKWIGYFSVLLSIILLITTIKMINKGFAMKSEPKENSETKSDVPTRKYWIVWGFFAPFVTICLFVLGLIQSFVIGR